MSKEKQQALIVVFIAVMFLLLVSAMFGFIVFMIYPLLIGLIFLLVGMLLKWTIEWCVKNIGRFRIPEKAKKVEEKLKIKKGVALVKESIDTLREKDDKCDTKK